MTWIEVLVEGAADEPVIREVLQRHFKLSNGEHFRVHAHEGKGKLPAHILKKPELRHRGLLDQLPAKLRAWGKQLKANAFVLVLIDVDKTPCTEVLCELNDMLRQLRESPGIKLPRVLFRLAIEETESWFIADHGAVQKAFPRAKIASLKKIQPDAVLGAWEKLAEALGENPKRQKSGADKKLWAEKISPHLDLDNPPSPSLRKLLEGIERELHENPSSQPSPLT
jgi:Domain of unknown function (DUF4276)